jgi:type III restriction enzyme
MVRETKSTKDFRKRRGNVENDKVRCGEQHFGAIGVSFDVVVSDDEV